MKIKKISVIAVVLLLLLAIIPNVYAASSSISVNSKSVEVGQKITVTATVTGTAYGKMKIEYSGPVKHSSGSLIELIESSNGENISKTISAVFETTGEGTATFKLTGDTTDKGAGAAVPLNKSVSVTVNKKAVAPPPSEQPSTPSTGGGTSTATKSNNAYLKSLQVNQEGLNPSFSKTKYNYSLVVNGKVDSINVTALAEHSKAKVSVSGNNNLKDGDNTVNIVVTAEDGSKKTYKIIVTKTNDVTATNAYLLNLIIENGKLSPDFEAETLEYTLEKVPFTTKKLDIKAFPQIEEAKVEIVGNDELVVGENTVKIIVTSKDGTNNKEYIIKVEREAEVVAGTTSENPSSNGEKSKLENTDGFLAMITMWYNTAIEAIVNNPLICLLYAFVLVEFIQILYLFSKVRKLNKEVNGVSKKQKENEVDKKIMANEAEKRDEKSPEIAQVPSMIENDNEIKTPEKVNYAELFKKNSENKEDQVIVKSIDFNTDFEPNMINSIPTPQVPKSRPMNSYDEFIKSKKKTSYEENNVDDEYDIPDYIEKKQDVIENKEVEKPVEPSNSYEYNNSEEQKEYEKKIYESPKYDIPKYDENKYNTPKTVEDLEDDEDNLDV